MASVVFLDCLGIVLVLVWYCFDIALILFVVDLLVWLWYCFGMVSKRLRYGLGIVFVCC